MHHLLPGEPSLVAPLDGRDTSAWIPLTPWMAQHSLDSLPPISLLTPVYSPRPLAPGSGGKGLSQVLTDCLVVRPWTLGVLTLWVLSSGPGPVSLMARAPSLKPQLPPACGFSCC